jgi:hypothetical protein
LRTARGKTVWLFTDTREKRYLLAFASWAYKITYDLTFRESPIERPPIERFGAAAAADPAIFAALDRLGFSGFVTCEYRPRARAEEGLGWAKRYGVVPKKGRRLGIAPATRSRVGEIVDARCPRADEE